MSKILIVDDEPNIVRVVALALQQTGHETQGAGSAAEALAKFDGGSVPDLVITDIRLGSGMNGLELLQAVLVRRPAMPVIVITAYGTIELAVEAMREGAFDFVRKPFDLEQLRQAVGNALASRRPADGASRGVSPAAGDGRDATAPPLHFSLLVGESAAMQRVYQWIEKVGRSDSSVLITGESGTGKELVARAIHGCSRRAAGPWVPLNCAALPAPLLESEMFGHAAGAFTGATRAKEGLFLAAHGGSLFLDEVGAMDLGIQSKFLRALQERKIRAVGETVDVSVDVRVIAATNESLEEKTARGLFREDLFFRINVIPIELPPLRHRLEDIPLVAEHFRRHQAAELGVDLRLADGVLPALAAYSWPGNIRELANAIACAAALCHDGLIRVTDLPPRISRGGAGLPLISAGIGADARLENPVSLRDYLRRKEVEYMGQILAHTGGNRAKAADLLGISRATFYRKLEEDGLAGSGPPLDPAL